MHIRIVFALFVVSSIVIAQARDAERFTILNIDGFPHIVRSPLGTYRSFEELPAEVRNGFPPSNNRSARTALNGMPAKVSASFVVSDAGDAEDPDLNDNVYSPATLRSAIQNANKLGGAHSISFSPSVTSIQPLTALPTVTVQLFIDGSIGSDKVVLDGSATSATIGLAVTKTSTVKNIIFTSWKSIGLAVNSGATNSVIQRNEFTLNAIGLNINAAGVTVGGDDPQDRNIAHGNTQDGIDIVFADDNIIKNNLCGTKDGMTASPNTYSGVYVLGQRTIVSKNVLSGNQDSGLEIGEYSVSTIVQENLIGLDSTGRGKLQNNSAGITTFASKDSIIQNSISANGYGITVLGQASQTYIGGNTIGSNKTLDSLFGNRFGGLQILGVGVVIENNTISCNTYSGILLTGNGGTVVRNNRIGTNPDGTLDWGNSGAGINILSDKNIIGGQNPADRNIISGNGGSGIEMFGSITFSFPGPSLPNYVQGNLIRNNYIGTDASGSAKIPNASGMSMQGYIDSNAVRDNILSGNMNHGLWLRRYGNGVPTRNVFTHNAIGVTAAGTVSLSNDSAGVMIDDTGENTFGGTTEPDENIVAYNQYGGIVMRSGSGFALKRNSIHHNAKLGIDLGNDGPTVNDGTDDDTGANNLQNFPVITFIKVTGGTTAVTGFLKSTPLTMFTLNFYTHDTPDSSGFGEGDTYQKTEMVSTDSAGMVQFAVTLSGEYQRVVATAEDPNGNTSEFSKPPIIVNSNGDAPDNNILDGVAGTGGPAVNGAPEVTLRAALQTANHLAGDDYISFDIPGNLSANYISPASGLPPVDAAGVTLDGTTQSGFSVGDNKIIVNGSQAGQTDGLQFNGSSSVMKGIDVSNFNLNGIMVLGNDLRIEHARITSNKLNGVYASKDLHLVGKISALNNGGGNSGSCSSGSTRAGIWVNNDLYADSIEVTGNCGSGITSDHGKVFIHGRLNASNNSEDGIRAAGSVEVIAPSIVIESNKGNGITEHTGNVLLKTTGSAGNGFAVRLNNNGFSGIYAYQPGVAGKSGIVQIFGKLQVNNNGPQEVGINFAGEAGIYGEKFIRVDEVEAKNNRGYGLFSPGGSVEIYGNAVIDANERLGVLAQFGLLMEGSQNSISNNREEGVYVPNGNMTVKGNIFVRNNNKKNCESEPELWLPKDTETFTSAGGPGGIGARSLNLNDADISGNCGAGIGTGIYLHVKGRITVLNNSGNGIQTRNAKIAGGRICNNAGYGIRLWGATNEVTAGFLELGSVQVCGNGLGGVKGVKENSGAEGKRLAKSPAAPALPLSTISGSSITDNGTNGLEFDSYSQLQISKTNISGNGQLGVKNNDTSIAITAKDVWWGTASGAGNLVSAGVDASNWRTAPVSLTVSHADDSTFTTAGSTDSVSVVVRNWQRLKDSVKIVVTESRGWLQSPSSVVVTTADTIPGVANIIVAVPENALPGDSTIVRIAAMSLLDSSAQDADSFVVLSYQPKLVRVFVLPDSVTLLKGDSVQFVFTGYDQASKPFSVSAAWEAAGGTIDSFGTYRADTSAGLFTVTGKDTASGLSALARVNIVASLTRVAEESVLPGRFVLTQNYPNPFNPVTTMHFSIPNTSVVQLKIFDILGREIATLVNGVKEKGSYTVTFDASKLASGIYFARLENGTNVQLKKMMLIK